MKIYCVGPCIIIFALFLLGDTSLLKKLKNKAQKFKIFNLKTKTGFTFGATSPLEYPGRNAEKLQKIHKIWDNYYDCLHDFNEQLGSHKSVTPEAMMAFEGTSVRFECRVCLSPADESDMNVVTWLFGSSQNNGTSEIDYGDHVILSAEDKSLQLYNLKSEDSGQYMCRVGNTIMSPYFLNVVNKDQDPILVVKPRRAPKGLHSQAAVVVGQANILVSTKWKSWSPCNKCGKVGKRVRYGICTVTFQNVGIGGIVKRQATLSNATNKSNATENTRKTRSDSNVKIANEDLMLLKLIKTGVPCRSSILPHSIRDVPEVRDRKSELMVGFCKVPCPKSIIFEVRDKSGNVVETANNSAGIYSELQGIPPVPPRIERSTMFVYTTKSRVELACPGNLNIDTPVMWQIGNKQVNPLLVKKESHGRIFIDNQDHVIIKNPRLEDSNIYSCWQASQMAGTIRLDVSKRVELTFNHHIMLLGMVAILGTFLIVFLRAFKGRKNVKAVFENN